MRSPPPSRRMPPPAKRPAAIQPRKESLAPKLASTATGREASAFMATTDQVPLRTPVGSEIVIAATGAAGLARSEPAFEVAAVDDAEHEQDVVFADDVVHDAVVADAEPVEGVRLSEVRLDLLAAGSAGPGCGGGVL